MSMCKSRFCRKCCRTPAFVGEKPYTGDATVSRDEYTTQCIEQNSVNINEEQSVRLPEISNMSFGGEQPFTGDSTVNRDKFTAQ